MHRYVVDWTGPSIEGLAVSVLHFDGAAPPDPAGIQAAFQNLTPSLPGGTLLTFPDGGDVIDPSTGMLTGVWSSGAAPAPVGGGVSNTAAAGVGACVTWGTAGIVGGKRVKGRTFVVPLATAAYENDGTLANATRQDLADFATALVAEGLAVWHRPSGPGASDGSAHLVTVPSVRDRVAVLRSRRF